VTDPVEAAGQHALPPDNPVRRWLGPPARFGAILAGWALTALAVIVGLEVVLRKLFSVSLQGADELGGYAVALAAAFGFAWTLLERAHTRIDLFMGFLPAGARRLLNVLALAAIAVFATFMAWRGWTTLFESIEYKSLSGTPLMTPLWWPQSLWAIGLAFFALVAIAALAHALWLLAHDQASLDRFYGARSLAEEIEEERRSLALRSRPGEPS
jgi:TRAP-type C4-dicarboxylate transport system permease small subunit